MLRVISLLVFSILISTQGLSAAVIIQGSETASSEFEAWLLPGNSTAGGILLQKIGAVEGESIAAKAFKVTNVTDIGPNLAGGEALSFAQLIASQGRELYSNMAPGFEGSNQTHDYQFVVCEKSSSAFENGDAFFFALPDKWDLNFEDDTSFVAANVAAQSSSNGLTLDSLAIADFQNYSGSTRAGVAVTISDNGSTSTVKDCIGLHLQHENVVGPSQDAAASVTQVYKFNGSNSVAESIVPDAQTAAIDLEFTSGEYFRKSVLLELSDSDDVINDFLRSGSTVPSAVTTRNSGDKISAGAVSQDSSAPTTLSRYLSTGDTDIYALTLSEPTKNAWHLFDAPTTLQPQSTLSSASPGAVSLVLSCRLDSDGSSSVLGTPVVTPLTEDWDVDSVTTMSGAESIINISKRSSFTGDSNDIQSKFLVQGLRFDGITSDNAQVKCIAKIRRVGTGGILEGLTTGEAVVVNGASATMIPILDTSADSTYNGYVLRASGIDPSQDPSQYVNSSSASNGNPLYFILYNTAATTIASASKASSGLSTISSSTLLSIDVADLPDAISASGDLDKLVTVTIPAGVISPGIPLSLSSQVATSDGSLNITKLASDDDGAATLKLRAGLSQTIKLTGPSLLTASAAEYSFVVSECLDGDCQAAPTFVGTVTASLDADDGYVDSGKILLLFEVEDNDTAFFDFSDYVANATVNNEKVLSLSGSDTLFGALVPANASFYRLKVNVDGTVLSTDIDVNSFASASGKSHRKVKLKDMRNSSKASKQGKIFFRPRRGKIPSDATVLTITNNGTVASTAATLNRRRKKAYIEAEDDVRFACLNSSKGSYCFDLD